MKVTLWKGFKEVIELRIDWKDKTYPARTQAYHELAEVDISTVIIQYRQQMPALKAPAVCW